MYVLGYNLSVVSSILSAVYVVLLISYRMYDASYEYIARCLQYEHY